MFKSLETESRLEAATAAFRPVALCGDLEWADFLMKSYFPEATETLSRVIDKSLSPLQETSRRSFYKFLGGLPSSLFNGAINLADFLFKPDSDLDAPGVNYWICNSGLPVVVFDGLVKSEFRNCVLTVFAGKEDRHSRQLIGFFLSKVSSGQLPDRLERKIQPQIDQSNLETNVRWSFHNCSLSEYYLGESIVGGNTVLVNDFLLVKGKGYKTGFCVRTTSTREGTFLGGSWYTPIDKDVHDLIVHALESRQRRLTFENGTWALVRDARDTSRYSDGCTRRKLMKKVGIYCKEMC